MKTIKVRIALEVASTGQWQAYGFDLTDGTWDDIMDGLEPLQEPYVKRHWIEAEVPVPAAEPATIAGSAVEDTAAPAAEEAA
jgi:hypothetical protein